MTLFEKNFISKNDENKIKEMDRLSKWIVHFGKYKNESFEKLCSDRDYCIWLIKQGDFINNNKALKKYIEYSLTT